VAPEGDQRIHGTLGVKSADMWTGVAKFYKEVMNARALVPLFLQGGEAVEQIGKTV
jgi:hypothetical protein